MFFSPPRICGQSACLLRVASDSGARPQQSLFFVRRTSSRLVWAIQCVGPYCVYRLLCQARVDFMTFGRTPSYRADVLTMHGGAVTVVRCRITTGVSDRDAAFMPAFVLQSISRNCSAPPVSVKRKLILALVLLRWWNGSTPPQTPMCHTHHANHTVAHPLLIDALLRVSAK